MDYLQEVARRQQTALARLLTGGRVREETGAEAESRPAGIRSGTEAGRTNPVRPAGGAEVPTEGFGARTEEEAAYRRWGRLQAVPAETSAAEAEREFSEQAAVFRQTRQADSLWRGGTAWAGELPGVLLAGREATVEVEDISRAVQRDARRYDGGFTMY